MGIFDIIASMLAANKNNDCTYVRAGEKAPCSGIIECTECGQKTSINKGRRVPPCQECGNGEWIYVDVTNPG